MSPQGSGHVFTVHALYDRLRDALRDQATVRAQSPLALSEIDEPEPDVVVVPSGSYRDRLPDRAFLVIEVSDSTRRRDLGPKSVVYARAGVPEYWVVDLQERRIVVHTDPRPDGYVTLRTVREGETLSPAAFPETVVGLADLFP